MMVQSRRKLENKADKLLCGAMLHQACALGRIAQRLRSSATTRVHRTKAGPRPRVGGTSNIINKTQQSQPPTSSQLRVVAFQSGKSVCHRQQRRKENKQKTMSRSGIIPFGKVRLVPPTKTTATLPRVPCAMGYIT